MSTKLFVYGYRVGSRSATALAQSLEAKVIRHENSKFRGTADKVVVNWGSTSLPEAVASCGRVLNQPELVRNASNKRIFFETCAAAAAPPRIPNWTLSKDIARAWLQEERPRKLFARTVLAGHSGEGIVKVTTVEELESIPDGTLIVEYVPKREEFRLHITGAGDVFSTQQKKKRRDVPNEEIDYQIRNLANGFIFARNEVVVPADVVTQARLAIAATRLDFGAVDVIYNQRLGQAFVLEVNTAPGLEGSTVEDYSNMIGGMTQ